MTEFKITIEAPALTEAINNLATAIGSAGRTAETAPATASAPKKRTKAPAPAPAPAEPVATVSAPVNPAAPVAPSAGTFAPATLPTTPATAVPTNAQPFTPGVPGVPGTPGVPTAPVGYTLNQLSNAGATLVEQGKMNELMALLARYGVSAITQLPPAQYPAIAAELIAMGAVL